MIKYLETLVILAQNFKEKKMQDTQIQNPKTKNAKTGADFMAKRFSFRLLIFMVFLTFFSSSAFCGSSSSLKSGNIDFSFEYSAEKTFLNPACLLKNPEEWKIQYPDGEKMASEESGSHASKFYSLYKDKNGAEWIHFALSGGEKGTSKNSKHPRSELRHVSKKGDWEFDGKRILSYTMNAKNTNPDAHFWVGQIHGETTTPPLMIRVWRNAVYLELKAPEKKRQFEKIRICGYEYGTDLNLKIILDGKNVKVYADGVLGAEAVLADSRKNYWKLGLYTSSTLERDPDVFYEVFIKDVEVLVE